MFASLWDYFRPRPVVLGITVALAVAEVALSVGAIAYHSSWLTLGFHIVNMTFIAWPQWLRYRLRRQTQPTRG